MWKTGVGYILYIGVLVRGYGGKTPLGRTEHRREAIIKNGSQKMGHWMDSPKLRNSRVWPLRKK
jgi:hypothetical protein